MTFRFLRDITVAEEENDNFVFLSDKNKILY